MIKAISILSIFLFSCSNTNLLSYRIRPYFKETDTYQPGSNIFFKQAIRYDRPRWNDEEYSFGVIFFVDSGSLRELAALDLGDTTIIQYYHSIPGRPNNFHGTPYPYKLTGRLTLLKWTSNKIRLKERITVVDQHGNNVHTYYGNRSFKLDDTSSVKRLWF